MLLRSPLSVRWRRRASLAFAALSLSYVAYAAGGYPHGGSAMGIAYGALGLAAILVLLYFGVRKRSYRSNWGSLESWLQSHIYLGLLAAFLILFHSGFRFHDRVAMAAFLVLLGVVASGLLGAMLYTWLPRRLSEVESDLTGAEISAQVDQLAGAMERLAAARSDAFRKISRALIEESLPGRLAGWRLVLGMAGPGSRAAAASRRPDPAAGAAWARFLPAVPAAEEQEMRQLLLLSRQRRELLERLVAQQRYRNLLDAWLFLHVPLSFVLMALVAAHLAAAFYYGRI